ncbi:uncharacterized protein At5g08430 isoform X1 [Lycium barbarum]|uniref:uncharacterized protein At5g08430 isoform X1 n=1 Tax=Lycium barbarum TaxID=112863 RepID=UPI00293F71D0|nr:uncharacterized protein At5g08430 isoform X1 [Lycium barbarum]XP_060217127.1 uncharacterized protein At5g08430 isoform X1 [Lycium barbarum]XP_060217128.1 uncharacterized protein At5g08430 isoform X1 [Lycium barbarum]XP_060217129.1 uncharacterized protein At5g08430 isoform X1 [Lycium barbarum]
MDWVEEVKDQSFPLKRKRNVRTKKLEFVGWGSRPLVEFLQSIGKDTSSTYSLQEVTAIVNEYVNSNNLRDPQKKNWVMCDARLHYLFGKKSILRKRISHLLEVHFSENHDESEDEPSNSSEEEDILIASKGRKSTGSAKKKVPVVPKSCFAAVIAENIKLVYLKRSLVQDLLKTPESFEDKIVGSFVRVKSDPNDYFQKNSHQLQQVEGVKKVSATSDAAFEIHLQLSNLMKDIPVSSLSNDDFSEEECEDLREKIKAGVLKRPTVLELESKAQVLHKDITKHRIEREIPLLQKRIEHANEKGWREQVFKCMEKKQLLQTKKEQDRLFSMMPKVVAEELEPEVKNVDGQKENEVEQESENCCSPKSTPNGATDNSGAGDTVIPSNRIFVHGDAFLAVGNGDTVIPSNSIFAGGDASIADGNDQHTDMTQEKKDTTICVTAERSGAKPVVPSGEDGVIQQVQVQVAVQPEVIELSDDDSDVEDQKYGNQSPDMNPEIEMWCYRDPQGNIQGPFSLTIMKFWVDNGYFGPNFRVWKNWQSPEEAILLIDVLHQFFHIK